jgi:hypothetical protein
MGASRFVDVILIKKSAKLKQLFDSGSVIIGEYSPRLHLGEHSPINILIVAIDTPGGNLSLKIKSRAQQITLNPHIIKVKIY